MHEIKIKINKNTQTINLNNINWIVVVEQGSIMTWTKQSRVYWNQNNIKIIDTTET